MQTVYPKDSEKHPQVLIFPALIAEGISEQPVYFLFSVRQVEDIFPYIAVYPVPFSPSYIEGIAQWQNQVLPVISIEKWLGLETEKHQVPVSTRLITVRTSVSGKNVQHKESRSIVRVIPPIRMFSLPLQAEPVFSISWLPNPELVRAVYKWEAGYLLVVRMEKISEMQE